MGETSYRRAIAGMGVAPRGTYNGGMSSGFSTHLGPAGVGTITLPVSSLSTEQYLQMIDAGILGPTDKAELIGGLITPMAPAGPEHNSSLIGLTRIFAQALDRYELAIQATIVVTEGHVFDPDLALLVRKPGGYKHSLPKAADVSLVVEAAASSLLKDRHVKLPAYAAAGVPEYWIIDLASEVVHVFRDPEGDGYRSELRFSGEQTIAPLACPELLVRAADLFA